MSKKLAEDTSTSTVSDTAERVGPVQETDLPPADEEIGTGQGRGDRLGEQRGDDVQVRGVGAGLFEGGDEPKSTPCNATSVRINRAAPISKTSDRPNWLTTMPS